MILIVSYTGDDPDPAVVNLDHSVKVVSARFLLCKFCLCNLMHNFGRYFDAANILFFFRRLPITFCIHS